MASPAHVQILGYPLPGNTLYPGGDGRRIDRIILENDRAFNVIAVDESNRSALLTSGNLNIPYIVRINLDTFTKTGRLVLDNGMSALTCAAVDPQSRNIWFGSSGYCVLIDPDRFEVIRFIQVGDYLVTQILYNPVHEKFLAIARGDPDGLIEIDPVNLSYTLHTFPDYSDVFADAVLCPEEMYLAILAGSAPYSVVLVDLNGYQVVSATEIPGTDPVTAMALNAHRKELYVAETGSPAELRRYDFPGMNPNGSIELPPGERPRNFMFCSEDGNWIYLNDGDSSGGLIRIDAVSFQREDRLDFGNLMYPVCFGRYDGTVLIATENTPGAILQVDPEAFTIVREQVFQDCETSAGPVFTVPALETVCLSVKNLGIHRLICFDPLTGTRSFHVDVPGITGSLISAAGDRTDPVVYLVETGEDPHVVSVDLQNGEMLERIPFPGDGEYRDFLYSTESGTLFLLTDDAIYEIDTASLSAIDSIYLEPEMIPATTFAPDQLHDRLLVGGRSNSKKILQYSVSPLALVDAIELESDENQAVLLRTNDLSWEIFAAVRAVPYRLKRYDPVIQDFTGSIEFQFNGSDLADLQIIPWLHHVLLFEKGGTTRIHRLDTQEYCWISPVDLMPGEMHMACHIVDTEPCAFISLAGLCSSMARYGTTQAHAIHGTWATLGETAILESLNFYSHESGNHVRLAVYDETGTLMWESASLENTIENGWLKTVIHEGAPAELILDPGEYLLAFQVTGNGRSPSATFSSPGSGARAAWRYGLFPENLITWTATGVLWSMYADCVTLQPSPTPSTLPSVTPTSTMSPTPDSTGSPAPTQSPAPSATQTAASTPTHTPTTHPSDTSTPSATPTTTPDEIPSRTPTPSPTDTRKPDVTATPRPGSGVEMTISGTEFHPGDRFYLKTRLANTDASPLDVALYVILDVFGSYWFAPDWSEFPDFYRIEGLLGVKTLTILDFMWPSVESEARGIVFWAGMTFEDSTSIFGYFDRVEFSYHAKQNSPTPTPTETASPHPHTPVPTPTVTPTDLPGEIRFTFETNDPMTYSGERCHEPETYCFAPERMNFCSSWNPVIILENIGESPVIIDVNLDGNNQDNFQLEYQQLSIYPGEIKPVMVRFCPQSPPDRLKTASVIVEWNGGSIVIDVKGWSVAG